MGYLPLKKFMDNLAGYAKNEQWSMADEAVPRVKHYSPSSIAVFANRYLRSRNSNLRDLAGTIAAELEFPKLLENEQAKLKTELQRELFSHDRNVFARFRSGIALLKHGIYEPEDVPYLKAILDDPEIQKEPEVRKIAERYKKKLKS